MTYCPLRRWGEWRREGPLIHLSPSKCFIFCLADSGETPLSTMDIVLILGIMLYYPNIHEQVLHNYLQYYVIIWRGAPYEEWSLSSVATSTTYNIAANQMRLIGPRVISYIFLHQRLPL
eukprot:5022325-Pleurochrysis_carterae.AAC.7